jgi:DNA primase
LQQPAKKTVADYIFEILEDFHFENSDLENLYNLYKAWYEAGAEPNEKTFLYHTDESISRLVISLINFPYELSERWKELIQGKKTNEILISLIDSKKSINRFRLKKIGKMIEEVQQDFRETKDIEQQNQIMELVVALNNIRNDIAQQLGIHPILFYKQR